MSAFSYRHVNLGAYLGQLAKAQGRPMDAGLGDAGFACGVYVLVLCARARLI